MPLTANQREAIDSLVNHGKDLPHELSSAVLAELDSVTQLRSANLQQIDQIQQHERKLLLERDSVLQQKIDMETKLDALVDGRVSGLRHQVQVAEERADTAESLCKNAESLCKNLEFKADWGFTRWEVIRMVFSIGFFAAGLCWLIGMVFVHAWNSPSQWLVVACLELAWIVTSPSGQCGGRFH